MKKRISVILVIMLLFSFTCCSNEVPENTETSSSLPSGESTAIFQTESENTSYAPQTEVTTSSGTATSSQPETTAPAQTTTEAATTTQSPSSTSSPSTTSAQTETRQTTENTAAPTTAPQSTEGPKSGKVSKVYFTKDISPQGLIKVYKAMGWSPVGNVAVKLSTGESSMSYYLDPDLIKDLVHLVNGTIVECNTAYGGVRSSTAMHKQLAKEHGFTEIANVDIMDEEGSVALPVYSGTHLKENYVGSHFKSYDSFLVLSHFKGHPMAGYGGAIKNISIGIASPMGKCWIHTAGKSKSIMLGLNQDAFLESMGEAGKAVSDSLSGGRRIAYVNVMNNLSVDCDCVAIPAKPEMADIGILASLDPVAVDTACLDLVYKQKDGDGKALVQRIESRNGLHTPEYAEKIGLGSRTYQLISID